MEVFLDSRRVGDSKHAHTRIKVSVHIQYMAMIVHNQTLAALQPIARARCARWLTSGEWGRGGKG